MTKLPVLSGLHVVRALERAGYVGVGTRGSHRKLHHPQRNLTVIVPLYRRALPPGTPASVLRQAGMTSEDLRALL